METATIFLETLADVMQVITALAATAIAVFVYRHNRRTDKESLRDRAWASQQELNYIALANPEVLKAAEFTIDGNIGSELNDDDLRRAIYSTFVQLNRVHLLWNGYRSGILSKDELLDEIRPTLTLISGNKQLVSYCLTRGYSRAFHEFASKEVAELSKHYDQPESSREFIGRIRRS